MDVRRYAPDGSLDRRLRLPAPPTSVMFGGSDLEVLFVTTCGQAEVAGRTVKSDRLGGSLLAVYGTGARGVPEVRAGA